SNSSIEVLDKITSITGIKPEYHNIDLKEKLAVKKFFEHTKVEGMIHFAASKAVGESVQMPLEYYENNIGSLIYILQELKANNLNNFIFSSSCTVYGQADELPITENAPIKPAESPYGNTKQIGEEIIKDATKISDLKAIALRYFNPTGAHESAKIGELPIGVPQNLIPYVVQTAAGLRKELSVFGSDYDTVDGTAVRDYIHVVDLAKAHIIALKRLIKNNNKAQYEIFNLGTGKGNSVLEVINTFEKVTGKKVNYKLVDRRAGDITAAYADTNYANNELGWKSELTLDDALLSAWKWQETLK
ncbi:MAG: UDP-glucose 4-epimerase GalE, partial [Lutibacter sp.]|nr:UDP-glucose 4-epimerase GalE [Lutibacter sp.]